MYLIYSLQAQIKYSERVVMFYHVMCINTPIWLGYLEDNTAFTLLYSNPNQEAPFRSEAFLNKGITPLRPAGCRRSQVRKFLPLYPKDLPSEWTELDKVVS